MSLVTILAASVLYCTPIAIDGDTIKCGTEKIRLLGIDAPEMAGHCRRGRKCVSGDPNFSKDALAEALRGRPLKIERVGQDRYGRTLALVSAGGVDLSCNQVRRRAAVYVEKWDNGRRVKSVCKF